MVDKSFTVEDAGGSVLHKQLMVDGLQLATFYKPANVAAAVIRNIPNFKIRDDDVMLCSFPKSGTHWGHEILSMLVNGRADMTPEMKITRMLEVQPEAEIEKFSSPRVLNTHMPLEWLPKQLKEKKTKTVVLARNPKDTIVSSYYHVCGVNMFDYDGKFQDFLKLFLEEKLMYGSWFKYTLDFEKAILAEPDRFHLVYYEDLKENGVEEIKKLAKFLNISADDELVAAIHEKCSFQSLASRKKVPETSKNNFSIFRKGEIGDWKNHFTVAENEAFDKLFQEKMKSSTLKFRFEPSS